jgi:exonuclease VII small subunit
MTASGDRGRHSADPRASADATALEAALADLERAAERLRAGDLDQEEAARLVEDCADLAARVGGELDRAARATAADPGASGQETLL